MAQKGNTEPLEQRILAELAAIEVQIANLTTERNALQNFLGRVRQDSNLQNREVTRKNSYGRIVVENRVLDVLKKSNRAVRTAALFNQARLVHYALTEATFRSHLHRMKERGLIVQFGRGFWTLPEHSNAPQI